MKRNWLIFAAVAVAVLQIGFLSWIIAGRAAVLRDGQEIVLKVEPVDPRDLLRGDYVRLGYEIASLPRKIFVQPVVDADFTGERRVHVLVRREADGVWRPVSAAFERARVVPAEAGDAVLTGTMSSVLGEGGLGGSALYGIERFYLPEGEGRQIETDMRVRPFFVVAAVAPDGTAQIKRFLDGETVLYEEPLY
ncbi:MAG: GDYXXLXY domain-containing protein [Mesorhizobium sp.]|nr:GDYXXLXY domain-containing protein [Mesorhizobium sp.]